MLPPKAFGRRLRAVRKAAHLTQQELGERADVSFKFIGGIERGEENPTLMIICKLAAALDVEPRDLMDFTLETSKQLRGRAKKMLDGASENEIHRAVRMFEILFRAEES